MDGADIILTSCVTIFVLILGVGVGMMLDPFKRAKLLRSLLKKDFGILAILSPDTKSIKMVVVDFGKDVIEYKKKVWIVLKDRIYRHDKPERGISLTKADLPVRWIEGIPVLYVNETSYMPIDITGDIGEVRPEEINSVFSAWINNQLSKMVMKLMNSFRQQQTLLYIIALLAFMAFGLSYMAYQGTNNCNSNEIGIAAEVHSVCLKTGACAAVVPATSTNGGH